MLGPERRTNLALDRSAEKSPPSPLPQDRSGAEGASDEKSAIKQALAADLEGMIEGMLRTNQFATAASKKTRAGAHQMGEAAGPDASTSDTAFSASSLIADLAQARGALTPMAVRPAAPRRWWIDAVLVLACLLGVASAGYLTFFAT